MHKSISSWHQDSWLLNVLIQFVHERVLVVWFLIDQLQAILFNSKEYLLAVQEIYSYSSHKNCFATLIKEDIIPRSLVMEKACGRPTYHRIWWCCQKSGYPYKIKKHNRNHNTIFSTICFQPTFYVTLQKIRTIAPQQSFYNGIMWSATSSYVSRVIYWCYIVPMSSINIFKNFLDSIVNL